MSIRSIPLALSLCVVSAAALAQNGINLTDMNPDVAACTNFYDYANGNWRAQHAIPDYMDRWSRRWESGEINKEHVRDILTDVSARQDWPAGSAEQLAGDFYSACMDESRVNELGVTGAAAAQGNASHQDRGGYPECAHPPAQARHPRTLCRLLSPGPA